MALRMDTSSVTNVGYEIRDIGESKGRGLFALKPFKAGEVIFEEKPLVSCQFLWNATYGYAACDFCMRSLETAEENARRLCGKSDISLPFPEHCVTEVANHVRCPHCEVAYCSAECRQQAWQQYHQTLCLGPFVGDANHPLEQLQEAWKHIHYPPESASIMLIARMIATVKQAKDKDGMFQLFTKFFHNTVNEEEEIAHKLLGAKFQDQHEMVRDLMAKAVYDDIVQQWFTPEGFRSLIALVGMNGQGIGTSPLSVWVKNCDNAELDDKTRVPLDAFIDQLYLDIEKESGAFLNNEGSALYSLQSSCNHSCVPNAEPTFPNNNFNLVMVAVKDIGIDEEICISYLDECGRNRSRHSRIKLLRENYVFTCMCDKCKEEINDPDVTSEDDDDDDDDEEESDYDDINLET